MNQLIDHESILNKIRKSKVFSTSQTYQRLLTYLVACTNKGEIPKETAIAIDVFGRDASFNPSEDTLVRVHIYKLRKKLGQYYEEEGREDLIKLLVPKGSYEVIFERQEEEPVIVVEKTKEWGNFFGLIGVFIVSLIMFYFQGEGKKKEKESDWMTSSVWSSVLSDGKSVQIVFGDIYVYQHYDSLQQKTLTIRDPQINSREDFKEMIGKMQKLSSAQDVQFEEYPYTFLIKNSVFSLQHLTQVFSPSQTDVQLRLLSHFGAENIYDTHIIYVGLFKSMGLFQHYLSNSSIYYSSGEKNEGEYVRLQSAEGDSIYLQSEGDPSGLHTDYGWFAKYPGPNQNTIMLFAGFHDTGVLQSVRHVTDLVLLNTLETEIRKKLGELPPWFEVLFEVQGIDRTEINPEIRYIFPIQMGEE